MSMTKIDKLLASSLEDDRKIAIELFKGNRKEIILWGIIEFVLSILSSLLVLPLIISIAAVFILTIDEAPKGIKFYSYRNTIFGWKRDLSFEKIVPLKRRLFISPFTWIILLIKSYLHK